MASRTEIANLALGHFGQSRIAEIGQSSPAAEAIRDCWDLARDAALRAHHWNFATSDDTPLTALAETAPTGSAYAYRYALPADFRRLVSVNGIEAGVRDCPFTVRGRKLLSNESTALIIYVRDVPETELWDAAFVMAFSFELAELVAPRITTDGGAAAMLAQRKAAYAENAGVADAVESRPLVRKAEDGSAYMDARHGLHPDIG